MPARKPRRYRSEVSRLKAKKRGEIAANCSPMKTRFPKNILSFLWSLNNIQWNHEITNHYITKPSVKRTITFTPVIVKCIKNNLAVGKTSRFYKQVPVPMHLPLPMPFVISRFHCIWNKQHQLHGKHYEVCICNGWKALTISQRFITRCTVLPMSSANLTKLAIGSAPGDSTNINGTQQSESS